MGEQEDRRGRKWRGSWLESVRGKRSEGDWRIVIKKEGKEEERTSKDGRKGRSLVREEMKMVGEVRREIDGAVEMRTKLRGMK